jgi:hypothetical protein
MAAYCIKHHSADLDQYEQLGFHTFILAWLGVEKWVDKGSLHGSMMAGAVGKFLELELGSGKEEQVGDVGGGNPCGVCTR